MRRHTANYIGEEKIVCEGGKKRKKPGADKIESSSAHEAKCSSISKRTKETILALKIDSDCFIQFQLCLNHNTSLNFLSKMRSDMLYFYFSNKINILIIVARQFMYTTSTL